MAFCYQSRLHNLQPATTAVAVDKDKNSQQALRWAIDHLLTNNPNLILIHVRNKITPSSLGFAVAETTSEANKDYLEAETEEAFLTYRGLCALSKINAKEVILEDSDVPKVIADYASANSILNIVVGASNRGVFAKRFRAPDVPTTLLKISPDFCAIYVVSRGKAATVRSAKGPAPANAAAVVQPSAAHCPLPDPEDAIETPFARRGMRVAAAGPLVPDQRHMDRRNTAPTYMLREVAAPPCLPRRFSEGCREFDADIDFQQNLGCHWNDHDDDHNSRQELEAEMRRLKLELKQTMDMYSTACKEALTAQQQAKELVHLKTEEARRFEAARSAEEAALATAEAKCRAALEAAEAAKRIAEIEAQKRRHAETKARREAEEKVRALDALAHNDVRYRKYTIDEIELGTEYFAEELKIGEGGYGPVFRGCLDHTPVAIKVLRPDAAQGRRQFNQEVEVLSCIRHPNMVILLGACPEYGCLVYEYLDNGSLEDRLFRRGGTPPLPWSVRFRIAAEVATALLFLHQTKPEPLVHRDLKPANILLDRNFVSKISDVGLARLVPASVADSVTQYRLTSAAGTFCYIDPEYQQTGLLGCKSDVYSLGVMLLQIVTARPPMGLTLHIERAIEEGAFEEVLDRTVKDWPVEECFGYVKLALKCTELRRKDRPDLGTVIVPMLNQLRNLAYESERGVVSDRNSFSSQSSDNNSSSSSTSSISSSSSSSYSSSSGSRELHMAGSRGPPGLSRLGEPARPAGTAKSNAEIILSYQS